MARMKPKERLSIIQQIVLLRHKLLGDSADRAHSNLSEGPTAAMETDPNAVPKRDASGRKIVIQNRDRSTEASIAQMNSIAANPDYALLSPGREFGRGTPVIAYGNVDAAHLGKKDIAAAANRRRINVQYAVVEADEVLTSNHANGSVREEYEKASADYMRAIAGNGRMAGITEAYRRGSADAYRKELEADIESVGISLDVVKAMRNPVLVRIMPDEEVTADIGDISNTSGNLQMNATETARNDAERVQPNEILFEEDGSVSDATILNFIGQMPIAERGSMIDEDGKPTKQGAERFNAAVFRMTFESDALVLQYAQSNNPDVKTLMKALGESAARFARVKGSELDISDIVRDAAQLVLNAKRSGEKYEDYLANGSLLASETEEQARAVALAMAKNIRSGAKIAKMLIQAADFAYQETKEQEGESLFADFMASATKEDVIKRITEEA